MTDTDTRVEQLRQVVAEHPASGPCPTCDTDPCTVRRDAERELYAIGAGLRDDPRVLAAAGVGTLLAEHQPDDDGPLCRACREEYPCGPAMVGGFAATALERRKTRTPGPSGPGQQPTEGATQ